MPERTLVLLRHAKAENPDGIPDADRPLTVRGHADATAAGAWLAYSGHVPDLVICSPARRTRQTWHQVAMALAEASAAASPGPVGESSIAAGVDPDVARAAASPQVRYEPVVYTGGAHDLLDLLRRVDEEVKTLLLVGHNPAISQLATLLDAQLPADFDGLRTSGAVVHRLSTSWRECTAGAASLLTAHTARAKV